MVLPQFYPTCHCGACKLGKHVQDKFCDIMLPLRLPPSKHMVSEELACLKEPSFVVPERLGQSEH